MGVEKNTLQAGNGQDFPKPGDKVMMHYTGCLFDSSKPNNMGTKYVPPCASLLKTRLTRIDRFDSSHNPGRGPFGVTIGIGQVIKGMCSFSGNVARV